MTDQNTRAAKPQVAGFRWEFLSAHDRSCVDAMIAAVNRAAAGLWPQSAPREHGSWERFSDRERMAAALLQLRSMEAGDA